MAGETIRRGSGFSVLCGVAAVLVFVATGAGAEDLVIEVPLDTVVQAPEGSEQVLATQQVPPSLVGAACEVKVRASNQRSVHPDNDLIVTSGNQQLVIEDVEGEAFQDSQSQGQITLAEQLEVSLVMGPDGIFSAGMTLEVTCPGATTTTTRPTTSTTVPTTTVTTSPTTTVTTESSTTTTTTTTVSPQTTSSTTSSTSSSTSTTTTTGGDTTSSTVAPSTLPFTGGGGSAAGLAGLALGTGAGLVYLGKRPTRRGKGEDPTVVEIEGVRVTLLRPGG